MSTIPANEIAKVNPSVLNAGGNALIMNGVFLTQSNRPPIGTALQFPTPTDVGNYFGLNSREYAMAQVYFNGFDSSTQKPGNIIFAQYNQAAVGAYLRGGNISGLTLAQLKVINGTLSIIMDGYTYSWAVVDLSSATSFTAAGALIQAGLNATPPAGASVTGSIAAGASSFTASIAGNVMYVTAVASGSLVPGTKITGTGVTAGTIVTSQIDGTTNGIGTYAVDTSQNVASTAITGAYGIMTVTAVATGTLSVGQALSGVGVTAGTKIYSLGTGTGLTGTYNVQNNAVVASTTITAAGSPLVVSYDSQSGGYVITAGSTGAGSTAAFATGTAAAPLLLTSATGAVTSQGAAAQSPNSFMTAFVQVTQNWATFQTTFDPDNGAANGSTQKQAFQAWNNAQNNRYAYIAVDADVAPTVSLPANTSMGQTLKNANSSGCILVWEPATDADPFDKGAFIAGYAASLDFQAIQGRTTLKFRSQTGLVADVSNDTIYKNLVGNGYNAYSVFATANEQFTFMADGAVSGPFQWADSYINQIWLNNQIQLAMVTLLVNAKSIPYNARGRGLISAAMLDPAKQALNFGAIQEGVTLSEQQKALINNSAGKKIDDIITQQGYYIQVLDATPQVRQARGSPPINFWYTDGQSVHKIVVASILIQ